MPKVFIVINTFYPGNSDGKIKDRHNRRGTDLSCNREEPTDETLVEVISPFILPGKRS